MYDISFAAGRDIFGTVGADGSVRMFDLRSLEHSTILFESPDMSPLLKSHGTNKINYVATILTDSPKKAVIIDYTCAKHPYDRVDGSSSCLERDLLGASFCTSYLHSAR